MSASADMAPPIAPDAGEEGSASRSRATGLRRSTRARGPSLPTATTPSMAGVSEPRPSSQRRGAGAGAAKEQSRAVGRICTAEDAPRTTSNPPRQELKAAAPASASVASKRLKGGKLRAIEEQPKKRKMVTAGREGLRRSKRRNMGETEVEAAASASAATEQAADASSAVSSPVRRPFLKRDVVDVDSWGEETLESLSNIDPAILDAYEEHNAKYSAKERSQLKLITLERVPRSCLDNPWFGPTHESAAETVLKSAKFVLGLSSYLDGKLLKHASGFVIEWDEESKVATVLTSALLICTKSPSVDEWLAKDEFAPDAEVHVHLLDKGDTVATAQLIHYHKHFNFALYKVKMDLVSQIPSFSTEVKSGQEIFVLGRDEDQHLMVDHGSVLHKGPNCFQRHHHMFASCSLNECCLGGPVIELNGQFLGMVSRPGMKFIPSVIILECHQMLKEFDCIPRLHTGMKFSAIRFLDPVHREKISRKCDVDVGLIVTEVSDGSIAEKVGIRNGDIIECWNGKLVSTTLELENLLLCMCKKNLDNGGGIGSNVEVQVGMYHVRKNSRCTVILTLKVRDDVEVVARGEYDVSTAISAMVSPDVRYTEQ